ncbi:MAG: PD-(D/E)XK nuclease family protein [Syntrophales bacterium]
MPSYSHSKLGTYENCPHQYKLKYIDRIEPPEAGEGIEAFLGSRVHETLEKLHKELILTKLNSLDDLLLYYKEQWDKNWHENILIVKKGYTKDNYWGAGREAITSYYKRNCPFNQSKTLATEYPITFQIDDYTIRGFIDRLGHQNEGIYEIHDYKTSGYLPSQEKIDNDRQLALYQIGIKEHFRDAEDIRLIWHYLIFDKELTSARTDAQLTDLKKEIVALIKTIEKDKTYEPIESNLCDWCEYFAYCPAKKHETKVQDLPLNEYLNEQGVSLVNKYASIKARIKELGEQESNLQAELDLIKEAAIEYARENDITKISGSDFILKITEENSLTFPRSGEDRREELEDCIKKAGIWDHVSGLNLSRLVKYVCNEGLDRKTKDQLMRFAEDVSELNVKLLKRKNSDDR